MPLDSALTHQSSFLKNGIFDTRKNYCKIVSDNIAIRVVIAVVEFQHTAIHNNPLEVTD